jgi:hypothetical protein
MAAQTWTTLQTTLMVALSQGPAPYTIIPTAFAALLPQATSYAEQRIYREIVPLNERTQNTSLATTASSRFISLTAASQTILTVEGFSLIYPAGTTIPSLGTRLVFDATSLDAIDTIWPQESVTMDPSLATYLGRYWALLDDHTLVFAPTVPAIYTAIITGTFEITPISATNPTTYLSTIYPDLLIAACMVFLTGALTRNYGAQGDDPKQAVSWENQYQLLVKGAVLEEQRRRMQGVGWTQAMPAPLAKTDRT